MKKLLVIVAMVGFLAGCCGCKSGKSVAKVSLTDTEWTLVKIDGQDFDAKGNYNITLSKDNRISGVGDCNRIMAGYEITPEGGFKMQQGASSRMLCPNQDQENKFLEALNKVDSYEIDGKFLMLLADSELILVLEAKK